HVRGDCTDEPVRLWRHLWSGSEEPFEARFHSFSDFVFGPLPAQGAALPILLGGRSEPALRRAGRLADWYQSSASGPDAFASWIPIIRDAAVATGRPMPTLSARVNVRFGDFKAGFYAMSGSPDEIAAEVVRFAELGVEHLAVAFGETDPERDVPVAGTPRFQYLVDRQIDSFDFGRVPLRFYDLMALRPPAPTWWSRLLGRRGHAGVMVRDEWPRIRADIDAGRLSMVGLVRITSRDPRRLGENHQVVCYGYAVDSGRLVLAIYDPNHPDDDTIEI